jgi:hypothetical protein
VDSSADRQCLSGRVGDDASHPRSRRLLRNCVSGPRGVRADNLAKLRSLSMVVAFRRAVRARAMAPYRFGWGAVGDRNQVAEPLVIPSRVETVDVLSDGAAQVTLTHRDDSIQPLLLHRADESLGVRAYVVLDGGNFNSSPPSARPAQSTTGVLRRARRSSVAVTCRSPWRPQNVGRAKRSVDGMTRRVVVAPRRTAHDPSHVLEARNRLFARRAVRDRGLPPGRRAGRGRRRWSRGRALDASTAARPTRPAMRRARAMAAPSSTPRMTPRPPPIVV